MQFHCMPTYHASQTSSDVICVILCIADSLPRWPRHPTGSHITPSPTHQFKCACVAAVYLDPRHVFLPHLLLLRQPAGVFMCRASGEGVARVFVGAVRHCLLNLWSQTHQWLGHAPRWRGPVAHSVPRCSRPPLALGWGIND